MNLYAGFASGILTNYVLSGVWGKPNDMAFGLTTVPPANNSITEVANAGNYSRQRYAANSGATFNWDYPTFLSGIAYNRSPVYFGVASAAWGMVSGAFIADSATYGLGNVLYYCTLSTPKDIQINDQFYIPASGASIRFS